MVKYVKIFDGLLSVLITGQEELKKWIVFYQIKIIV